MQPTRPTVARRPTSITYSRRNIVIGIEVNAVACPSLHQSRPRRCHRTVGKGLPRRSPSQRAGEGVRREARPAFPENVGQHAGRHFRSCPRIPASIGTNLAGTGGTTGGRRFTADADHSAERGRRTAILQPGLVHCPASLGDRPPPEDHDARSTAEARREPRHLHRAPLARQPANPARHAQGRPHRQHAGREARRLGSLLPRRCIRVRIEGRRQRRRHRSRRRRGVGQCRAEPARRRRPRRPARDRGRSRRIRLSHRTVQGERGRPHGGRRGDRRLRDPHLSRAPQRRHRALESRHREGARHLRGCRDLLLRTAFECHIDRIVPHQVTSVPTIIRRFDKS